MKIRHFLLFIPALLMACTNDTLQTETNDPGELSAGDHAGSPEDQELFDLIREKDSLLFEIGFNQIDTLQVAALVSEDLEFYHDEHGIIDSKEAFVQSIQSIGDLPFKTWRVLETGSMEVFPLYTDNKTILYGILQTGVHSFYQQEDGEAARKTSTARFSHLWILENAEWKLKRVLSYDHQSPE